MYPTQAKASATTASGHHILILGVDRAAAAALGGYFGQAAIIFGEVGGTAELVVLA